MNDGLASVDVERSTVGRARKLGTVGALCLVALLIVVAAVWLGGGQDVANVPAAVETDEQPEPEDPTVDDGEDVEEALPVVTHDVYLARDPFEPVRTPPSEEASGSGGDADTIVIAPDGDDADDPADPSNPGEPSPSDPSDPSYPTDPDAPDGPGGEDRCDGGEDEAVCNGHVVTLLDIATEDGSDVASIQVDTTVYEVREGEGFADRFQLLEIDRQEQHVHGLYGDARFRLRVGERTLK